MFIFLGGFISLTWIKKNMCILKLTKSYILKNILIWTAKQFKTSCNWGTSFT